ncbi:aminoglycoside phosphotransferase [Xylanimonas cellulosilytica DSM 15894]|uniref:Aminoglycoside phosphotransferase n=1 Tax=Xylanimonas cellulosilytica (strain DSM 15894 / JCM 12276 / CECT 5975 / KCTC 9989 / LMG 20990 / NBRC 107835 / XIL07) TaxID=446471 RepID=D1BW89_XYLCX|nr:phosphotransferase [Xylanimonas cellulosilytica]ACZ31434.1 aminoglycoside phosphotransferase [Xylanimonas cellulosilytica DSM 15894]
MSLRVAPAGTHLPAEVTDLVAAWAPGRRWFPGGVEGRPAPWLELTDDAGAGGAPDVVLAVLRLEPGPTTGGVVLQVPLVITAAGRDEDADPGYIGTAAGLAVHDGGAHPAAWDTLLRAAGLDAPDLTGGRTLTGEQSNTSVVLPHVRPPGAPHGTMLKILRTLTAGDHPDVTVPQALTAAGFTGTPRFLGAAEVIVDGTVVDLAVLAALVPDAHDGFEHACRFAGRGDRFDALAAELGAVVARLHTALRDALPTDARLEPAGFVSGLRRRAAAAIEAAPSLAPHADAVGRVLDDLQERLTAVPLQRIHGDLHLGQALYGADGWQLLDFEGEPQRPVAERTAPDLPVRDVAGMLRSFDYAAAVGGTDDPAWSAGAKAAFLDAYRAQAGDGLDDDVLRALVLDKALYEVVYETRQRPHWVHIPLGAVERLLAGAPLDG